MQLLAQVEKAILQKEAAEFVSWSPRLAQPGRHLSPGMMSRRNLASWRIRQRWGWCSRWRNTTQVSSRHLASALARQVDSSATLKKRFLDEILSQKIMPQNCIVVAREMTLCLTEIQAADGAHKIWRVWLHTDMLRGTCASRGRLIGFKSDSAELANGFMIFNKVGIP